MVSWTQPQTSSSPTHANKGRKKFGYMKNIVLPSVVDPDPDSLQYGSETPTKLRQLSLSDLLVYPLRPPTCLYTDLRRREHGIALEFSRKETCYTEVPRIAFYT